MYYITIELSNEKSYNIEKFIKLASTQTTYNQVLTSLKVQQIISDVSLLFKFFRSESPLVAKRALAAAAV